MPDSCPHNPTDIASACENRPQRGFATSAPLNLPEAGEIPQGLVQLEGRDGPLLSLPTLDQVGSAEDHGIKEDIANADDAIEQMYNIEWSAEEQAALDRALAQYSKEKYSSNVERYVRIAVCLDGKGVRDVAARVKWLTLRHAAPLAVKARKRKAIIGEDNVKMTRRQKRGNSNFAVWSRSTFLECYCNCSGGLD